MRKGLLLAITLRGAVTQKFASLSRSTSASGKLGPSFNTRLLLTALALCALITFTNRITRAQSTATSGVKHLASFRSSDTPEGTRVTITSDSPLDDYTA